MKSEHYEEAKNYFVLNGFSIDTIATLMADKVSRKTLYNWRKENNWDEDRKFQLKKAENLRDDVYELAAQTVREAKANPTANNIFAVGKMMSVLKNMTVIKGMETPPEEVKKTKNVTPETIKKIEELLGL